MAQLYHLTVVPPSAVTAAAVCTFEPKSQSLVLAKGSWIEEWRPDPDPEQPRLVMRSRLNVFATIRAIAPFRLSTSSKDPDNLAVTSDAGTITILEMDLRTNRFRSVLSEPFGKSGLRRAVPGGYLAVDPQGRAIMIASIEKSRLVYVLNRDDSNKLVVSSPIEAHVSDAFAYEVIALDVGFANPAFAVLEKHAGRAEKVLTLYELNLGLNNVFKQWSRPVADSTSVVVALPGGREGPSGLLCCASNRLEYIDAQGVTRAELALPTPQSPTPKSKGAIVSAVVQVLRRQSYFVLVQNANGDIFKVVLDTTTTTLVATIFGQCVVSRFFGVFKAGFLWACSEFGNHGLYQFLSLDGVLPVSEETYDPTAAAELENISLVEEMPLSIAPLTTSVIRKRQLIVGCGRSDQCSVRTLVRGLEVDELVESVLNGVLNNVFAVKQRRSDQFDKYIVLASPKETLVLGISAEDGSVSEVSDSGIEQSMATLDVVQVGKDALVQVHSGGLRHVSLDKKIVDWSPPAGVQVVLSSGNSSQILLALSNHELVYFEADAESMLNEYSQSVRLRDAITAIAIATPPTNSLRATVAAVACSDSTLRILSLDPKEPLKIIGLQSLSVPASSIRITTTISGTTWLHIGLSNGIFVSGELDVHAGQLLADTVQTRVLGSQAVHLEVIRTREDDLPCVLVNTTTNWLYAPPNLLTPLLTPASAALSSASSFSSEDCPRGVVGVSGKQLIIFAVDRTAVPLKHTTNRINAGYTPLHLVRNSLSKYQYAVSIDFSRRSSAVVIIDADNIVGIVPVEGVVSAACNTRFTSRDNKEFLVVATNLGIAVFDYVGSPVGSKLALVHDTEMAAVSALVPFKGMLLAGSKATIFLYDIGLKRLLRKASYDLTAFKLIRAIAVNRNRIFVGDVRRNIALLTLDNPSNGGAKEKPPNFLHVADYASAYGTTALLALDADSVCVGDKHGNLVVLRVPANVGGLCDDPEGLAILATRRASKEPYQLDLVNHFYVQDAVSSLHRGSLAAAGGFEGIIYTGVQGTVGALVPLLSQHDYKLVSGLEEHLRDLELSGVGRSHAAYRGYYAPAKHVVDGDLCEQFGELDSDISIRIAEMLEQSPREIGRRLAELRERYVF